MASERKIASFRLLVETLNRAHARAEEEAVPLTALVEEYLQGYARGAPQPPDDVQKRLAEQGIIITGRYARKD